MYAFMLICLKLTSKKDTVFSFSYPDKTIASISENTSSFLLFMEKFIKA